ncbi:MAG: ABC transporter ATP-binding protein [bacterium]
MNEILQVENLEARYPESEVSVLKGIHLSVSKGEFIGLIGPNGSGKSTLLRVISKVLPPFRGEVRIEGESLSRISCRQLARKVAVVSQIREEIHTDLTVEEFVLLGRSPYHRVWQVLEGRADLRTAEQAMAVTNTIDFRRRSFRQLSGGEQQRALIARALAQQPKLLLLDEATSHLDINYQLQIFDLLRSLNEEKGITVLSVLHDLNLAAEYCRRLVLLRQGASFAQGLPQDVITTGNIRQVYQAMVDCRLDPITQKPHVFFPCRLIDPRRSFHCRIHVVCGGGSGSEIIRRLVQEGFRVSTGVLNLGDSDEVTARYLDIPVIEEKPFSPISEAAFHRNMAAISISDFVLLAPIMIGHGNIHNLQAVDQALAMDKQVIVIGHEREHGLEQQFDFTEDKEGKILYQQILDRGGHLLEDLTELFPFLAGRL